MHLCRSEYHIALILTGDIFQLQFSSRGYIIDRLGLISIERGIGVNEDMLETCLVNIKEYIIAHSNNGKLRNLSGMKLKIGKYLGLADDGSCIIPVDWRLK